MPKQVRQIGAQTRDKKNLKRKNHWKRNKSDVIKDKARRKAEDPLSAIKVEKKVKKWIRKLKYTEREQKTLWNQKRQFINNLTVLTCSRLFNGPMSRKRVCWVMDYLKKNRYFLWKFLKTECFVVHDFSEQNRYLRPRINDFWSFEYNQSALPRHRDTHKFF